MKLEGIGMYFNRCLIGVVEKRAKAPFTRAICKKIASFLGLASWLPSQKKAS